MGGMKGWKMIYNNMNGNYCEWVIIADFMMMDVEVNFNQRIFWGVVYWDWFNVDVVCKNQERGYLVGVFDNVKSVL